MTRRRRNEGRHGGPNRTYCTLAVTEAVPVIVNVQVLVLSPPLEQAPDQMASRPFVTLNVLDVLTAKLAEPFLSDDRFRRGT